MTYIDAAGIQSYSTPITMTNNSDGTAPYMEVGVHVQKEENSTTMRTRARIEVRRGNNYEYETSISAANLSLKVGSRTNKDSSGNTNIKGCDGEVPAGVSSYAGISGGEDYFYVPGYGGGYYTSPGCYSESLTIGSSQQNCTVTLSGTLYQPVTGSGTIARTYSIDSGQTTTLTIQSAPKSPQIYFKTYGTGVGGEVYVKSSGTGKKATEVYVKSSGEGKAHK